MRDDFIDLPAFVFPVVAWAPEAATGVPDHDGIASFGTPAEIATTWSTESAYLGWTFVDDKGRCWKVADSRIAGRAEGRWMKALPAWLHRPQYRRAFDFAEHPPLTFEAVRNRLLLAVDANPDFYRDAADMAREGLFAAKSLSELLPSEDTLIAESFEPLVWWKRWLHAKGRCSRLMFLTVLALDAFVGFAAIQMAERADDDELLAYVPVLFGCVGLAITVMARRLHDLGVSAWWLLAAKPWLIAMLYFHDNPAAAAAWAILFWPLTLLGLLVIGWLALWPGTPGPNPYGFKTFVPKPSDD